MRKHVLSVALLAGGVWMAACAPDDLPEDHPEDGWVVLFDGETLNGWRGVGRDSVPSAHWIVEDGTIRKVASGDVPVQADGQPLTGGDIMTEQTWPAFELRLEWKVAPGANSGIKYNVSEDMSVANPPRHAALGFEYQILDDDLHPDAANGPNRHAAAMYDLIPANERKALRPVGEWNEARVVFDGRHGEHWLNGEKVIAFDLESERFDSLFAQSKYVPVENFAAPRAGHIVLQDHGDDVWFRNIRIRTITP